MIWQRLYQAQLAQVSYLLGCTVSGEALIVDPNRDVEAYLACAAEHGLRISAVAETHMHADFVSGARELAQRTGAALYLSGAGLAAWTYTFAADAGATLLRDGDRFHVGTIRIDVIHTPGHTPEHLSLLVTDTAGAGEPMGICTGDFLFVGDIGRPDLLEQAAGVPGATAQAVHSLFDSIQLMFALPDYLQIWPGHGAGSACGRALSGVPHSTIGYERRTNWAFSMSDVAAFRQAVLDGQPEVPRYFGHVKRVNQAGPQPVASLPAVEQRPVEQLATDLETGVLVVDVRPAEQYAAGHVPGTLNLPLGPAFLTWAGALIAYDRPVALLAEPTQVPEAVRLLRLIGLDRVTGFWTPAVLDTWTASGPALARIERIAPPQLGPYLEGNDVVVVDVRDAPEHAAGRIPGSINLPLTHLLQRLDALPTDRPLVVYCQGGSRSAIAASVIRARRLQAVFDLTGGLNRWHLAGNPVQRDSAFDHAERVQ